MTAPLRRSSALEDFADQMRVLQRECAWKREKTHTSLIPYVREEAEEPEEHEPAEGEGEALGHDHDARPISGCGGP